MYRVIKAWAIPIGGLLLVLFCRWVFISTLNGGFWHKNGKVTCISMFVIAFIIYLIDAIIITINYIKNKKRED